MYKPKRNNQKRVIQWLRHEGYHPTLNPFFKHHFKQQFLRAHPYKAWLMGDLLGIFRNYDSRRGWVFVVLFANHYDGNKVISFVFVAKTHTPELHVQGLRSIEPLVYYYLDELKSDVRGSNKRPTYKFNTKSLTLTSWWKTR